jgi:hypothetical protein
MRSIRPGPLEASPSFLTLRSNSPVFGGICAAFGLRQFAFDIIKINERMKAMMDTAKRRDVWK